jgi:hypothetical protein
VAGRSLGEPSPGGAAPGGVSAEPFGVFSLTHGSAPLAAALARPYVRGACVRAYWRDVEPQEGRFTWTLSAVSIEGGPLVAFFNKNLFQTAGLKLPEARPDGWGDWSAFLESARKLTRAGTAPEDTQFATLQGDYWNWICAAGGEIVNRELTKCLLDRPEAIEGLQMWSDLVKVHRVAPAPAELQGQNVNDWFRSGRLATFPTGRFFASASERTKNSEAITG